MLWLDPRDILRHSSHLLVTSDDDGHEMSVTSPGAPTILSVSTHWCPLTHTGYKNLVDVRNILVSHRSVRRQHQRKHHEDTLRGASFFNKIILNKCKIYVVGSFLILPSRCQYWEAIH